jgi:transposase
MARPLPVPVRQNVFRRWQVGDSAADIAADLGLALRTVERLVRRFRQRGEQAIYPDYRPHRPHRSPVWDSARRAALALRQEHPRWGALLIRVVLRHRFADSSLACPRTLQRWFRRAGLGPAPKGRYPTSRAYRRASRPHAVWQMDAAEKLRLANGHCVCWLRIVDEHTGAVLLTVVFAEGRFSQVSPARTQAALRKAFTTWGLPDALRVDNGPPWGSANDLPTDLALWVLGMGVEMIWNPPRQPRRNGVVERFQGVGQCWLEPESCFSAGQLQRKANWLDRLQREEYPVAEGKSRIQVHPRLAHSGKAYNRSWERAHWSLNAVATHLGDYNVPRVVDGKGMISLYNRNCYVGRPPVARTVWVTFDPQRLEWIVCDAKGNQVRRLPAPEISGERIVRLSVSNKRAERGR